MRHGFIAGLAALMLANAGWAQTPPPEYAWSKTTSGSTRVAAWTVKSNQAGALPQLMVLARDESAGKTPGEWVRASALVTLEVNCANTTGRILEQVRYGANFAETGRRTQVSPWTSFFQLAEGQVPAQRWCAAPGAPQPDAKTATIDAAQAWLDAMIPQRKPDPAPPKTANFEYAGFNSEAQHVDKWLDGASITREGKIASAWVFEAWQAGWKSTTLASIRNAPARWMLYEFDCETKLYRGVWFADLNAKLEIASTRLTDYNKFVALNDQNLHQIGLRACNNRPILFSEKYSGDITSLVAAKYGAGAAVGSTVKPLPPPPVTRVDMGPTIRITARNKLYSYVGTFTGAGAGTDYSGDFMQADGTGKYRVALHVVGVIDGQLVIEQSGTVKDELRIPVANGKPSGKGISWNARDNDEYSWTLVEPATITVAAPKPAPVPAASVPAAPVASGSATAADKAAYALPADKSLVWRQHVRKANESSAWAEGAARPGGKPLLHIINHMTSDSTQSGVPGPFRISVATIEYDCAAKTYRGVYAAYHDRDGKLLATSFNGWGPVRFDVAHPLGPALQARCSGAAPPSGETFSGNYVAAGRDWLSGRH